MKFYKSSIKILCILVLVTVACKSKKQITTEAEIKACNTKVTYETLQPLLTKSCNTSGCHDESQGKMNFKIYANLKNFAERGEVKEHVLIEKNMPPNEKLTGEELMMVRCWIEGGMLEK